MQKSVNDVPALVSEAKPRAKYPSKAKDVAMMLGVVAENTMARCDDVERSQAASILEC